MNRLLNRVIRKNKLPLLSIERLLQISSSKYDSKWHGICQKSKGIKTNIMTGNKARIKKCHECK
jgi:hypothetical protein